jgi:hypothetical protein
VDLPASYRVFFQRIVEAVDVSMPFQDIDHFKPILGISKEDYVSLVSIAAEMGMQLVPRPTHNAKWGCREFTTFGAELVRELHADAYAPTFARDIA